MTGIIQSLIGSFGAAVSSAVTDAYFYLVTLLLPGNGTNGAQNNTFLDSSSNTFSITRNGNTTQGTFSPFSQTGWSNYFTSSASDYLSIATNTAFSMGTGNFTAEFWFYSLDQSTSYPGILSANTYNGTGAISIRYDNTGTSNAKKIFVYLYGATAADPHLLSSSTYEFNQWIHVAVVRDSSTTTKLYVNGILQATGTVTAAQVVDFGVGGLNIGRGFSVDTTNAYFLGNISSLRIIKGQALTTGDFTPPTVPVTTSSVGWTGANVASSITGTVSLLTCQSNRFLDNSTANSGSPFSFTVNGTPSIQAFSPFAPTAAYSAATNGGSGYFDGTGDYLTMSSNAALAPGTGDFTIEAWLYPTAALSTYNSVYETAATNGMLFGKITSGYGVRSGGTADLISSTAPAINQWVHVAASRSGTDLRLFINGELKSTVTNSTNFATGIVSLCASNSGTNAFPGYVSGLRFVKGTALYTATFTVPTAPPTAVSNTNFLCNFTNAGITDATAKNVLETVGNAQISTTQSKWGGSSIAVTGGTANYLIAPNIKMFTFAGAFTVEAWVYRNTSTSRLILVEGRTAGGYANYLIGILANGTLEFITSTSGNYYNPSETITSGQWVHVALVRDTSDLVKLYVNGVGAATTKTIAGVLTPAASVVWLGAQRDPQYSDGYIDDFRITQFARYTANFTPPTAAFALQ